MFIRSLPFIIPRALRATVRTMEIVLLDTALLGIAIALRIRIGSR